MLLEKANMEMATTGFLISVRTEFGAEYELASMGGSLSLLA